MSPTRTLSSQFSKTLVGYFSRSLTMTCMHIFSLWHLAPLPVCCPQESLELVESEMGFQAFSAPVLTAEYFLALVRYKAMFKSSTALYKLSLLASPPRLHNYLPTTFPSFFIVQRHDEDDKQSLSPPLLLSLNNSWLAWLPLSPFLPQPLLRLFCNQWYTSYNFAFKHFSIVQGFK